MHMHVSVWVHTFSSVVLAMVVRQKRMINFLRVIFSQKWEDSLEFILNVFTSHSRHITHGIKNCVCKISLYGAVIYVQYWPRRLLQTNY